MIKGNDQHSLETQQRISEDVSNKYINI